MSSKAETHFMRLPKHTAVPLIKLAMLMKSIHRRRSLSVKRLSFRSSAGFILYSAAIRCMRSLKDSTYPFKNWPKSTEFHLSSHFRLVFVYIFHRTTRVREPPIRILNRRAQPSPTPLKMPHEKTRLISHILLRSVTKSIVMGVLHPLH